jgi:hypothetical protein
VTKVVVAALLVLAGTVTCDLLVRRNAEEEARRSTALACQEAGGTPANCQDRVRRNHAACFREAYRPGSDLRSKAYLDHPRYQRCVLTSPDADVRRRQDAYRVEQDKMGRVPAAAP